jgi:hypothetical protein
MADEIIILRGNTTNHSLELSDGGHTRTKKGKVIKWKITDDVTNVVSIVDIKKKSGDDIFSELPTKEDTTKWKAKIKDAPPNCGIYVYSITWTDDKGTYTYDPIISINPTRKDGISKIFLTLLAAVFTAFTVTFLQRKQSGR